MESLLRVVGAAGQDVPCLGYVDVEVEFPVEEAGLCSCLQALVLVVPDNAYNQRVPLVIGMQRPLWRAGRDWFSAEDTHLICMEKSIPIHAGSRASCEWPPEGLNEGSSTNSGSP